MKCKKWTDEEVNIIKNMYPEEPRKYILEELKDRKWESIKTKARKLGIKRKVAYKMPAETNHYFFDNWSNEMAYILGLICADGNIKNGHYLKIKLAAKDYGFLKDIRDIIAPGRRIYDVKCIYEYKGKLVETYAKSLEIGSQYICKKLRTFGVVENKTKILEFPSIPNKYISHFIRGYFDGDGCINKYLPSDYSGHLHAWSIIFAGNKKFLTQLNKVISTNVKIDTKTVRKESNCDLYIIKYFTYDSIKLGQFIYKDSTIHLDRKYKLFQQLLDERK